jgi:predicted negative regulator of RcsB-dependent stress response
MAVKFEKNCYFQSNGGVLPEVKSRIQFQYGNVTRVTFNQQYDLRHDNQHQIRRKFAAVPSALMTLARMVANLAFAAIFGLPSLVVGNTKPLKYGLFRFVRNGEILTGRLISIFHDRLGLYHIQQGQFQKACYALSMQKSFKNESWEDVVHQKSDPLIKKHYDKNNLVPVTQEIEKTFLKPDEQKLAFADLLDYAVQQKDVEFIKKIKQIKPFLFSNEDLKIAEAQIQLEMGNPDKAVESLKYIYSRNHEANVILQRCSAIFYERGDINQAFEALDAISGDLKVKDNALIQLGEKCIQNNQLEAARKVANRFFIYKDGYQQFVTNLIDKYLENKNCEAAFDCVKERLDSPLRFTYYVKIARLLIKEPSQEALLFEICNSYPLFHKREHFLISFAAELLQSNDPDGAKQAVILCFKKELIDRHFDYISPNATETQRIKDLSLRLGESSFVAIKHLLQTNQKEAAFKKVKQILDECQENPKDPKPEYRQYGRAQPGPSAENFFNFFFNGANFNGNPFGQGFNHQGFNFAAPLDPNLPKVVAKLKPLEVAPQAPILVEFYEKCLKAQPKNYHTIFGLEKSFTEADLKKASRSILVKIHPDKFPGEEKAANEITAVINGIRKSLEEWVTARH